MSSRLTKNTSTTFTLTDEQVEGLFSVPTAHQLVPVFIMALILVLLLLACLYDCKVNRDCFRKRSDSSESIMIKSSSIYLYDGETGEARPSHRS